ncbi:DNase TatD family [Candidatus Rickettsiella viridis]|uniref:DNase TatD family n=1 Tax=Candidatus Rickettsiella viridis TaxID=676208 RepID=A0A2Z5UUS5_9COXI|nr:TatD family hydrolase [Candidatus Rickettsiella viridis]BBB15248.1 DNase TatD family [Candidatus Rickettsiella viridis]
MYPLVDSHCHLDRLDLNYFQKDLHQLLASAREQGVIHFLCVGIDLENFPPVLSIAEQFSDVSASVGIHPTEDLAEEPSLEQLIALAKHPKVVAIGETGLDYYRDTTKKSKQQTRFRQHIQTALAVNKPLIVHTRHAREDTIAILKEEGADKVGGVLHCFTEDLAMANAAIEIGFYISFSGILTFKNAKELQAIAQQLPLERILIETDSPYLAPAPFRGKPCQPAYVHYVAEKLAELRQLPLADIAQQTTTNFFKLFHDAQPKP